MKKWDLATSILLLVLVILLTGCSTASTTNATSEPLTLADGVSEVDMYLTQGAASGALRASVLIARDGEILLRQGYGFADLKQKIPNTSQTKFRIGSVTKQFTAVGILILQTQGKLTVQDRLCAYLSECPMAWKKITIHHLFTHTSGIPNFTGFIDYNRTKATPSPPEQTINRFLNKPLDFQPGQRWNYSNSGYILLGLIIEQASGQSYETFLQENVFEPLGMTSSGYDHNRDDLAIGYKDRFREADFAHMSIPFAAGGLYSTVEDLYRWDQALYTEQLLPQTMLDEMFTPHAPVPDLGWLDSEPSESAYGYGWMIGKQGDRRIIEHGGGIDGFVSLITRYPDDKTTIIVLSNQENSPMEAIQREIARRLFGDD